MDLDIVGLGSMALTWKTAAARRAENVTVFAMRADTLNDLKLSEGRGL
jgi:hypothetical protein